jgi:hypothetical protein
VNPEQKDLPAILQKKISRLAQQERKLFEERSRLWAHQYLSKVYDLVACLSIEEEESLCGTRDCGEEEVLRKVLERTTEADAKTRSRWLQALIFADDVISDEGGTIEEILGRYGGIAGCARAIATPKRVSGVRLRDWK